MTTSFLLDGKTYELELLSENKNGMVISLGGESHPVDFRWITENELSMLIDGRSFTALISRDGKTRNISIGGEHFIVEEVGDEDEVARAGQESAHGELSSPMPGNVIKVKVKEGDEVKKGASLIIVEAMKMENEIRAPYDALVEKLLVTEGEVVDAGSPLVDLKPLE